MSKDNSIPFYNGDSDKKDKEFVYRSDEEAIQQAYEKFLGWAETGSPVFTQDDYAILFQAGTFEYGKNAEQFCDAVFRWGPIPGERTSQLSGESVAPRPATGEVDFRGSQRIVPGGTR